jgi:hypothetical protein
MMGSKKQTVTVVMALIAGLVGGVVSSWFFVGQTVFAEKKALQQKVVRAEEFMLVDEDGTCLAKLTHIGSGVSFNLGNDNRSFFNIALSEDLDGDIAVMAVGTKKHGIVNLFVDKHGPRLSIIDGSRNLRAVLGKVSLELESGSTETRAPSSLVLFNKKSEVTWKAP